MLQKAESDERIIVIDNPSDLPLMETRFLRRCFGDAVILKKSVVRPGKRGVTVRSKNPYGRTMNILFLLIRCLA